MTTTTEGTVFESGTIRRLGLTLAAVGATAFVYSLAFGDNIRAWQSLLINFLFFGGLAQAGVVLSATMQTTSARWGLPLKRLSEATGAFLPVAFGLLLILLLGISSWAPWVHEPIEAKTPWLNIPFFVSRQILAFLFLGGLSTIYLYRSLRPDIGMLHEIGERPASSLSSRLITNWQGIVRERLNSQRSLDKLGPGLLITYAWVFSLVAFDFVMALEPHWFSTLMGAYYFVGNLLVGIAFVSVVAVWGRVRLRLHNYIGPQQLHDIGKLLFGFSILWAYMLWSQYLVIWYGDLPEETEFIYHRMHGSWAPVTWTVITLGFVVPFTVLLSRTVKTHSKGLTLIAFVSLAGMWLERFLLVSPSIWDGEGVPLGAVEVLISGGVLGLFSYCYITFLETFPVLPVSDLRLAVIKEDEILDTAPDQAKK